MIGLKQRACLPWSLNAALPPLEHPDVPQFNYSLGMRIKQLLVVCSTVVVFLAAMALLGKVSLLACSAMGDTERKVRSVWC